MKKEKSKSRPSAGKKKGNVPKIEISESPEYKLFYASGVFGGIDANDSRIIFFLDRLKPKMKDSKGGMELDKVNRELQAEVHMSPHQFIAVAKWMMEHAQRFGKDISKKKKKDTAGTSYIG